MVILPRDHHVIERKLKPAKAQAQHRQIRLRPMPLLHRVLPALPARLRRRAAPGHAQPGLHRHRRGVLEPVGGAVLLLRPLHALRLPGGTVSQGSLRRRQGRDARQANQMDRADERQAASDARRPPRADQDADARNCTCRTTICPRRCVRETISTRPAGAAAQAKRRRRHVCRW